MTSLPISGLEGLVAKAESSDSVRWDNPTFEQITLEGEEKTFFENLSGSDIVVDVMLRYNEDVASNPQSNSKLYPLVTFTDGEGGDNNLMLYHATYMPGANKFGGMAFMTPKTDKGWRFSSGAAYVDDTKWHKLTYVFARKKQDGAVVADEYLFNEFIDDRGSTSSGTWSLTTDARKGVVKDLLTGTWKTSSVYIGAPAAESTTYPALTDDHFPSMEQSTFPGEIAYVTVRKTDYNEGTFDAERSKVGNDIQKQYDDLKAECEQLDTSDYTEKSFRNLQTALALPAQTEWDVYNAIDAIQAARTALEPAPDSEISLTPYVYLRLTSDLENWKVSTDAGSSNSTQPGDVLKDDSMWVSEASTVDKQDNKPQKDNTLVRNNNIYLTLSSPETVTKMVYYCDHGQGQNGSIVQAKVYVAKEEDAATAQEVPADKWVEVSGDEEAREYNNEGTVTYKFNEDEGAQDVKYVRMEVLHTDGQTGSEDSYIAGYELELYKQGVEAEEKISGLTAYSEAKAQENMGVEKLVDGNTSSDKFHTLWESAYNDTNYLEFPIRRGFVANNNFYITMPVAKNLGMLTYVAGQLDGSIMDANIYVSNSDQSEAKNIDADAKGDLTTMTQEDQESPEKMTELAQKAKEGWVKVYDGHEDWAKYNNSAKLNNGHSVCWTPLMAKHVRIEVEHTYGPTSDGKGYQNRNTRINAKRFILYEALKEKNVAASTTIDDDGTKTTIAAYSGEDSGQGHYATKIIDGNNDTNNNEDRWVAKPDIKDASGAANGNKDYVVLDLGENTRTLVNRMDVQWHFKAYATHYVIETSDSCNVKEGNTIDLDDGKWVQVYEGHHAHGETLSGGGTVGPDDSHNYEGTRPDNSYFNDKKNLELKRYVRLVADEMNKGKEGNPGPAINSISIRQWEIWGDRRKVTPIDTAKIDIVEPVSGETPQAISRTSDSTDFTVVNVEWTDEKGNKVSQFGNDTDHAYVVTATLKPDASKIFDENSVVQHVDIGGETILDEKNDQTHIHKHVLNDDDTMEITHIFKQKLTEGEVTVAAPVEGTDAMHGPAPVSADGKYKVKEFEWSNEDGGRIESATFEAGKKYRLTVTLEGTENLEDMSNLQAYCFADNATMTIAGQDATEETSSNAGLLKAYYTFECKADTTTKLTTVSPKVHRPMSGKTAAAVEAENSANYTVESTTWKEDSTSQTLEIGGTFDDAKEYKVEAVLEPAEGYAFADGMSAWLADADKANAKYKAKVTPGEEGTVTVSYKFDAINTDLEFYKQMLELTVQSCGTHDEKGEQAYTSSTWSAYKTAKDEAQRMIDAEYVGEDANTIEAATEDLGAAAAALKYRVTMPTALTVDAPQYNGVQPQVTMTGAEGITATTLWYKEIGDGNGSRMAQGAKFEAGNYYVVMALQPDEGYGFEASDVGLIPSSITVGEKANAVANQRITQPGEDGVQYIVFSCKDPIEVAAVSCNCKIDPASLKVTITDGGDVVSSIDMGAESTKTVKLTATASVTCSIPEHQKKSVAIKTIQLKEGAEDNAATQVENKDGAWELTVNKAGTAYVTITMEVPEDKSVESVAIDAKGIPVTSNSTIDQDLEKLIQSVRENYDDSKESNYTNASWDDLQNKLTAAEEAKTSGDNQSKLAAYRSLNDAIDALRLKIAKPNLKVTKPAYDANQKPVETSDTDSHYTITTNWVKFANNAETAMSTGERFKKGIYRAKVTLTPAAGYAFEDTTKPDTISVVDGEQTTSTPVRNASIDKASGRLTFYCQFEVTVACTCQVGNVTIKINGENVSGASIDLGAKQFGAYTLTASAKVSGCADPDHQNGKIVPTYSFAEVKDESNMIEIKQLSDGTWQMTVARDEEDDATRKATIKATASIKTGTTKENEGTLEFTVTQEPLLPADPGMLETLKKDADELKKVDQGATDDYTERTLQAVEDAIKQVEKLTAEGYKPTNEEVTTAAYALYGAGNAVKQEKAYADLKRKIEELTEDEYPANVWAEMKTAQENVEDKIAEWTAEDSELPLQDYEQDLYDLVTELQTKYDAVLAATQEDPELTAAKKAVADALAAADATYKAGKQDGQTDDAWNAFKTAYEAAKNPAADATAAQLNKLADDLKKAQAALNGQPSVDKDVEAAKKAVEDALAAADATYKAGKQDGQTDDAWNAFKTAYEAAKNPAAGATAAQLNKLADDLKKAQAALKNNTPVNPPADPEVENAEKALQEKLAELDRVMGAGQLGYSDETWDAFRKAYQDAKNHGSNLTAQQLTDLLNSLCEAQEALAAGPELKKAQEDLAKLLEEAKKTKDAGKGTCPDAVWSKFEEAYEAAAKGKDNVDTDAVTKLCSELNTALANVKKAQTVNPGAQQPTGSSLPKVGTQYTVGKLVYQVKTSSATDKTVMVVKPVKKTNKKLTIPATVNISGLSYKVVEIKASAFAKNKKLSAVTIGKNVTKIGKKAFLGCAKLKKVTIKAAVLKTIGKQAFAKINKKAKIKVPKKQLKTLKKKLKKAKTIKSAKITK